MKKLTAGIFASILGLTAIGAADAAVTSKQYVDNAIDAAKTAVTQSIAGEYATKEALTAETNTRAQADTTMQGNIDTLTTYVGTIPSTSSSTNVVAYVDEMTSGIASEGQIEALDGRLDIIEGDYVTEQELTTSQTNQNAEIKTAYEAADATVLQEAKNYADQNDDDTVYDDAEVRGLISGNTTEINTIKVEQTTQNESIAAAQTAANEAATAAAAAQTTANEAATAASTADGKAVAAGEAAAAAQTTADNAAAAAAAAAKISTQKGYDGVYVLTATVAGDSTTYKWEVITRTGSETDETTTTSEPAGEETTGA